MRRWDDTGTTFDRWKESLGEPASRGLRITTLILVTIAVLLGAVKVYGSVLEPAPVAVVRDYLEAIRARDLPRAARRANPLHPENAFGGGTQPLQTSAAISDGWRVAAVEAGSDEYGTIVNVTLAGKGRTATGVFELVRFGRQWTILNPLGELLVSIPAVAGAIDVNGVTVREAQLRVLPGLYQISNPTSDVFAASTATNLVVTTRSKATVRLAIDETGKRKLTAMAREYVDDCAEDFTGPYSRTSYKCPLPRIVPPGGSDSEDSYSWTIVEYPTIAATIDGDSVVVALKAGRARGTVTSDTGAATTRTVALMPTTLYLRPDAKDPTELTISGTEVGR
ncbi:MAG: hypothetical protein ACRDT6_15330 [Micromonosporaceae bacterium]